MGMRNRYNFNFMVGVVDRRVFRNKTVVLVTDTELEKVEKRTSFNCFNALMVVSKHQAEVNWHLSC